MRSLFFRPVDALCKINVWSLIVRLCELLFTRRIVYTHFGRFFFGLLFFLVSSAVFGTGWLGAGAGISHLRQVYDGGSSLVTNSLMLHGRIRFGSTVSYVGRISGGIPLSASIDSESVPLESNDMRSVSLETFQGVGLSGGSADGIGWTAALGAHANLTYIVREESGFGPPPVTAIGPAVEGGVTFPLGGSAQLELHGMFGTGLFIVEMAEGVLGASNVSHTWPFGLSVGLNFPSYDD